MFPAISRDRRGDGGAGVGAGNASGDKQRPAGVAAPSNKKVKRKMSSSLNFYLIIARRTTPESFNGSRRRSSRAGGALSDKKVKRKMSNPLNFYLFFSPPAAPLHSHWPGGSSSIKKLSAK